MIGATAKIALGTLVAAALLIAVAIALCADLMAPETRPALRRSRTMRRRETQTARSLMEAGT